MTLGLIQMVTPVITKTIDRIAFPFIVLSFVGFGLYLSFQGPDIPIAMTNDTLINSVSTIGVDVGQGIGGQNTNFLHFSSNVTLVKSTKCTSGFSLLNDTEICVLHYKTRSKTRYVYTRLTKEKAIDVCHSYKSLLPTDEKVMSLFANTLQGKFLKPPSFWFGAHYDEGQKKLVSDYPEEPILFKSNYIYSSFDFAKMIVTSDGIWWSTKTRDTVIPCVSKQCYNYKNMLDFSRENCTVEVELALHTAFGVCEKNDLIFPSVRSKEDNDQIRDFFLNLYPDKDSIHVGLNLMKLRGHWYTVHDQQQMTIEYQNWARGHPEEFNQLRTGYDGTKSNSYIYSCVSPQNMLQFFCVKNATKP